MPPWKTVRIFISSTFRDMQAERDHLVRFVSPRLREQRPPLKQAVIAADLNLYTAEWDGATEKCTTCCVCIKHFPKHAGTMKSGKFKDVSYKYIV